MSSEKDLSLFVRYGSLNRKYQEGFHSETYHSPPTRKGFYAFPYIAQEWFLVGDLSKTQNDIFKDSDLEEYSLYQKKMKTIRRVFKKHKGFVWHHLSEHAKPNEVISRNKDWVKTSLYDWRKIIMRASINSRMSEGAISFNAINGRYSKDHLEVFFEDKI